MKALKSIFKFKGKESSGKAKGDGAGSELDGNIPDEVEDTAKFDSGHTTAIAAAQAGGEPVSKCGWVEKRGGMNRAFKKRWIVVTEFGRLVYFENDMSTKPLGQFTLSTCHVEIGEEDTEFNLMTPTRTWVFKVDSEEEVVSWINAINHLISEEFTSDGRDDQLKILRSTSGRIKGQTESTFIMDLTSLSLAKGTSAVAPASITVSCITWNLAEQHPSLDDLEFIRLCRRSHLIVIGVQECKSLMKGADKDQVDPTLLWQAMTRSMVGKKHAAIAGKTMGPIHVDVYASSDIIAFIENISIGHVACGVGNVLFNKGACGVSFDYREKSVAFVVAHLAARNERVMERRADFLRIDSCMVPALMQNRKTQDAAVISVTHATNGDGTQRPASTGSIPSKAAMPRVKTSSRNNAEPMPIMKRMMSITATSPLQKGGGELKDNFDFCIFMGDLNYRIDGDGKVIRALCYFYDVLLRDELSSGKNLPDQIFHKLSVGNIGIVDTHDDHDDESLAQIEKIKNNILRVNEFEKVQEYHLDDEEDESRGSPSAPSSVTAQKSKRLSMDNEFVILEGLSDSDEDGEDGDTFDAEGYNPSKKNGSSLPRASEELHVLASLCENVHTTMTIEELSQRAKEIRDLLGLNTSLEILTLLQGEDQLYREKQNGEIFHGFEEMPILFKPSYKFDPGTLTYDTGDKKRSPAYCDRVLIASNDNITYETNKYTCFYDAMHSDHRPVVLDLTLNFK
jgi:hypothetical protein